MLTNLRESRSHPNTTSPRPVATTATTATCGPPSGPSVATAARPRCRTKATNSLVSIHYCMDQSAMASRTEETVAPPTRTPRGKWIEHGLRALAAGGPEAVRIESLAEGLGVTRGSFYWHFRDRQALLEEMLDRWEKSTTEDLLARLDREGGDAYAKLRRLLALTSP